MGNDANLHLHVPPEDARDERARAEQERDEALAEVERLDRAHLRMAERVGERIRERDEARAEVERLRAELRTVREMEADTVFGMALLRGGDGRPVYPKLARHYDEALRKVRAEEWRKAAAELDGNDCVTCCPGTVRRRADAIEAGETDGGTTDG